jgi:parallel beta-helix repeat protein
MFRVIGLVIERHRSLFQKVLFANRVIFTLKKGEELKRIASSVIVVSLFLSLLAFAFIQPAKASGTIYIRADGSIEGTDKIASSDNVTYTLTGNIHDCIGIHAIELERDNIVLDGAGYMLEGGGGDGINLVYRSNVTVKNLLVSQFRNGILSDGGLCNSIILSGNSFFSNENGINIGGNNITLTDNIVFSKYGWGGVFLSDGSNDILIGNKISSVSGTGMTLYNTNNTIFAENTFFNSHYSVELCGASNSKFSHNNFFNNTYDVYTLLGSSAVWDEGYPSGGNYWSNYIGIDYCSGPYQNETGSDGIGDTPYRGDNYPLMYPWSSLPVLNMNTWSDYATIQEAINANETLGGNTILVKKGTYYENVVVSKSVSLIGENPSVTIIDGSNYSDTNVLNVCANNVTISGFTIQHAGSAGINLYFASHVNITRNTITNNPCGVSLGVGSSNNIVAGNNITQNSDGVVADWWVSNNTIVGNSVTDNVLCGISLSSNYNQVFGNYVANNLEGISLNHSSYNIVSENNITNNADGVTGYGASDNIIISNSITNHRGNIGGRGIGLWSSNYNTISRDSITNNYIGIILAWSNYTSVVENNLILNSECIGLAGSSNNTMRGNSIINNEGYGISLDQSSNNTIYHNNFINNTKQAYVFNLLNVWDNGVEGNFWSDYTGADVNPHDGIGDTPHILDISNQDNYPLMSPYLPGDYNHDGTVNMTDADMVRVAWQSRAGDLNYNPHTDFNMDDIINIKDAAMVGLNWLKQSAEQSDAGTKLDFANSAPTGQEVDAFAEPIWSDSPVLVWQIPEPRVFLEP